MFRKCLLVLSISLFLTAGFIYFKAQRSGHGEAFFKQPRPGEAVPAVAADPSAGRPAPRPDAPVSPAPSGKADQASRPAQESHAAAPASPPSQGDAVDAILKQVAALQSRDAAKAPADGPEIVGDEDPAAALADAAGKRASYLEQVKAIQAKVTAAETEFKDLAARLQAATAQGGQRKQAEQDAAKIVEELAPLEQSLAEADQNLLDKEAALTQAREAAGKGKTARDRVLLLEKELEKVAPPQAKDQARLTEVDSQLQSREKDKGILAEAIAALSRTEAESAKIEASLGAVNGQTAAAEVEALRRNIAQARKSAATALGQKQAALQDCEKTLAALHKERESLATAVASREASLQSMKQQLADAQQAVAAQQAEAAQLAALETAAGAARRQKQMVQVRVEALKKRQVEVQALLQQQAADAKGVETLQQQLAEAERTLKRVSSDRDTYQARLASLDERIVSLQERLRGVLKLADAAMGETEFPPRESSDRSLLASLGDAAFATGDAALQDAARKQIAQAIQRIKELPGYRVSVEGHAEGGQLTQAAKDRYLDTMNLSLQRARAVADAILAGGVESQALTVAGHGGGKGGDKAGDKAGKGRVEIWLVAR